MALCVSLQVFTNCASAANGDLREALRKAFAELDSLVAGSRNRTKGVSHNHPVQRSAGAMVVYDLRSGVCYTAATAAARSAPVLCSVLGAFNSESTEGRFLGHPDRHVSYSAGDSVGLRAIWSGSGILLLVLQSDASINLAAGKRGRRRGAVAPAV